MHQSTLPSAHEHNAFYAGPATERSWVSGLVGHTIWSCEHTAACGHRCRASRFSTTTSSRPPPRWWLLSTARPGCRKYQSWRTSTSCLWARGRPTSAPRGCCAGHCRTRVCVLYGPCHLHKGVHWTHLWLHRDTVAVRRTMQALLWPALHRLSAGSTTDALRVLRPGVGADEARSRMWLFDSKVRRASILLVLSASRCCERSS